LSLPLDRRSKIEGEERKPKVLRYILHYRDREDGDPEEQTPGDIQGNLACDPCIASHKKWRNHLSTTKTATKY
jgi:hypothetical protein